MPTRAFALPQMSEVSVSVSYVDIDARSPLNQNESHIHRECEIYLNLSGDVAFEVEGRVYPISRGSVIITRPYEFHHCVYRSDARHTHYWITFSAGESEAFLEMFFRREKGNDNLIVLSEPQLQELLAVLERLMEPRTDQLALRIDCLQLFRILRDGKRESQISVSQSLPPEVAQALRFMDDHLAEDLDIPRLCAACNVSVSTLERRFQEAFRTTPFAMLRKKRLFASMAWLRGGASVAEAAGKSGFSDYSHYIQLFRRQFGITPLRYKREFTGRSGKQLEQRTGRSG